jgi:protein gp37
MPSSIKYQIEETRRSNQARLDELSDKLLGGSLAILDLKALQRLFDAQNTLTDFMKACPKADLQLIKIRSRICRPLPRHRGYLMPKPTRQLTAVHRFKMPKLPLESLIELPKPKPNTRLRVLNNQQLAMVQRIKEDAMKHGFQSVALKDAYGRQGILWQVSTCPSKCSCSPGCDMCPAVFLALKRGVDYAAEFLYQNLLNPLRLRTPRMVFVCPEGDLYHSDIERRSVAQVYAVMDACPDLCFVTLTKRAEPMADTITDPAFPKEVEEEGRKIFGSEYSLRAEWGDNIIAGVSVENQKYVKRAEVIAKIPEPFKRAVFASPMIGPLDLSSVLRTTDWVVQSRERGSSYGDPRECKLEWIADLREQCRHADVPFYTQDKYIPKLVSAIGADCRQHPRHRFFKRV